MCSVFGLVLYWGLISLPATTRRDGFNFSFSVFFFLVENPWAYRERATCNGLAVGFACRGLLGLDRLVLFCVLGIFFFFFLINTSVLCPLC